jgi:hypothetical protein
MKERGHLEKTGLGEWAQNEYWLDWLGGVEWIQVAQDREQLWALVNTVVNLQVLAPELVS